jgi:hypothetical protein
MNEIKQGGMEAGREAIAPGALFDAAWAALMTGRRQELNHLQELLQRPLDTSAGLLCLEPHQLLRLEQLLAATARNLRLLRGQYRSYCF